MDERDVIKKGYANYRTLRSMRIRKELKLGEHYTHDEYGNRSYTEAGMLIIIKYVPKSGRPKKCQ